MVKTSWFLFIASMATIFVTLTTSYASGVDVLSPRQRVDNYRKAVATVLKFEPPPFIGWSCRSGSCTRISNALYTALTLLGIDLNLMTVSTSKHIDGAPGGANFHAFLVDGGIGENEIIIDPTFKQYFTGNDLPGDDIFIGTHAELEDYFTTHQNQIARTGEEFFDSFDGKATCEKIYGYGRGAKQFELFRSRVTRYSETNMNEWRSCELYLVKENGFPAVRTLQPSGSK